MKKTKQVSMRVHTRKIDRLVAHANMKKAGVTRPNKKWGDHTSFFSDHWRDEIKED